MSRPLIEYRTTSRDAYDEFKAKYPSSPITFDQFKLIIKTCNELIIDHILETGDKLRLPGGFGDISINKWKPRKYVQYEGKTYINLPVDWPKSRLAGKKVYHLNAHTDGYRYKWKWFQRSAFLEMRVCIIFRPNRTISRRLAKYLKKPNSTYGQLYRAWPKS